MKEFDLDNFQLGPLSMDPVAALIEATFPNGDHAILTAVAPVAAAVLPDGAAYVICVDVSTTPAYLARSYELPPGQRSYSQFPID